MPTVVNQRQILDRQQWETIAPFPFATVFGMVSGSSTQFDQMQMWVYNTSTYLYNPRQDAWHILPDSGLTSEGQGLGGALAYHPSGPTGTATAGAASTITTTLGLPGSLAGYTIRLTGGTGAGQERIISANTYLTNSVITVTVPWTINPDATSVFLILSGRFWFLAGNTPAMRYYDIATNTWSAALTITGFTSAATVWRLSATPSFGNPVATGTATSGSATTLVNSAKNWTTNQWANYQVRVTAGTGVGQVRAITSNTATTLTIPTGATLDSTSVYVIEPNDDFLYATNAANVTLFRYSISGNSWSTLTPGTARTPTPVVGAQVFWIGITTDASWADETNIKNGRYLYGFNGGATMSYYDLALNTWTNLTNAQTLRSFYSSTAPATGTHMVVDRQFIYLLLGNLYGTAPNQFQAMYRYDAVKNTLEPFGSYTGPYPTGSYNSKLALSSYTDGGTTVRYLYHLPYTGGAANQPFLRMQIVE